MRANERKIDPMAGVSDMVLRPAARAADDMVPFVERVTVITANGPRDRAASYEAGCPARVSSALDLIEARSRGRAPVVFTARQHNAAEAFEALACKVHGGNVKLSSLDGVGGGGSGLSVTDAMIYARQRYDRMLAAVGTGAVLSPRGVAAQAGRRSINRRDVVWSLVVMRTTAAQMLARKGWAVQTRHIAALHAALADALDAMAGV